MITYHEVVPLLFEAFPDIHREYLEYAERNGPGSLDDDEGRPMPYCILPWLMWQVRDAVKVNPAADLARMALAFVEKIARDGDEDARELIYIEVAEVFAENLAVRRLMGPATQLFAMHRSAVIQGAAYSHALRHGWRGYRVKSDVKDRIRPWLPRRAETVVAEAVAHLQRAGLPDGAASLPSPVWDWPAADLRAEMFPEQLRSWLQSAREALTTGNLRRAKGDAALVLEGVLEWERCKGWGLV